MLLGEYKKISEMFGKTMKTMKMPKGGGKAPDPRAMKQMAERMMGGNPEMAAMMKQMGGNPDMAAMMKQMGGMGGKMGQAGGPNAASMQQMLKKMGMM